MVPGMHVEKIGGQFPLNCFLMIDGTDVFNSCQTVYSSNLMVEHLTNVREDKRRNPLYRALWYMTGGGTTKNNIHAREESHEVTRREAHRGVTLDGRHTVVFNGMPRTCHNPLLRRNEFFSNLDGPQAAKSGGTKDHRNQFTLNAWFEHSETYKIGKANVFSYLLMQNISIRPEASSQKLFEAIEAVRGTTPWATLAKATGVKHSRLAEVGNSRIEGAPNQSTWRRICHEDLHSGGHWIDSARAMIISLMPLNLRKVLRFLHKTKRQGRGVRKNCVYIKTSSDLKTCDFNCCGEKLMDKYHWSTHYMLSDFLPYFVNDEEVTNFIKTWWLVTVLTNSPGFGLRELEWSVVATKSMMAQFEVLAMKRSSKFLKGKYLSCSYMKELLKCYEIWKFGLSKQRNGLSIDEISKIIKQPIDPTGGAGGNAEQAMLRGWLRRLALHKTTEQQRQEKESRSNATQVPCGELLVNLGHGSAAPRFALSGKCNPTISGLCEAAFLLSFGATWGIVLSRLVAETKSDDLGVTSEQHGAAVQELPSAGLNKVAWYKCIHPADFAKKHYFNIESHDEMSSARSARSSFCTPRVGSNVWVRGTRPFLLRIIGILRIKAGGADFTFIFGHEYKLGNKIHECCDTVEYPPRGGPRTLLLTKNIELEQVATGCIMEVEPRPGAVPFFTGFTNPHLRILTRLDTPFEGMDIQAEVDAAKAIHENIVEGFDRVKFIDALKKKPSPAQSRKSKAKPKKTKGPTVAMLKNKLEALGLDSAGRKQELLDRLAAYEACSCKSTCCCAFSVNHLAGGAEATAKAKPKAKGKSKPKPKPKGKGKGKGRAKESESESEPESESDAEVEAEAKPRAEGRKRRSRPVSYAGCDGDGDASDGDGDASDSDAWGEIDGDGDASDSDAWGGIDSDSDDDKNSSSGNGRL